MRNLLIILLLFISSYASAQKYMTKTGLTEFKASEESFQPVEAKNKSTTAVLDAKTGEVAALLFIKAFHFEVALMEEHFNENYMGSDKFPKASFKGKIEGFDLAELSNSEKEFKVKGTLTIKGESKPVETLAKIKLKGDKITVKSEFIIQPESFGIEVPSILRMKIAKNVNVIFDYELIRKS